MEEEDEDGDSSIITQVRFETTSVDGQGIATTEEDDSEVDGQDVVMLD